MEAEALDYVRSKWPEAEWKDVERLGAAELLRVKQQEELCIKCRGSKIHLCSGNRFVSFLIREERGKQAFYTLAVQPCPIKRLENLIAHSGLIGEQRTQTFRTYRTEGLNADIKRAKGMAMRAAEDGSWLILAGLRGTGKSHLAAAIMHEVMKRGKQALFRLVPEMLDDLRKGYEDGTHYTQMKALKTAPCLVLDDLGKERNTDAGYDFLYQIVDARYRERRQTIITTNAMSYKQLVSWGRPDIIEPILSRMMELGVWFCIRDAEDYRVRLRHVRNRKDVGILPSSLLILTI